MAGEEVVCVIENHLPLFQNLVDKSIGSDKMKLITKPHILQSLGPGIKLLPTSLGMLCFRKGHNHCYLTYIFIYYYCLLLLNIFIMFMFIIAEACDDR